MGPTDISPAHSPLPRPGVATNVREMDFPIAMREVINKKKITRVEWNSLEDYCFFNDEYLMIKRKGDEKLHQWAINDGDLLGIDWIVIP